MGGDRVNVSDLEGEKWGKGKRDTELGENEKLVKRDEDAQLVVESGGHRSQESTPE